MTFLDPRRTAVFAGDSVDLVRRWSTDVLALEPSLVSVLIGINDTWRRYDEDDPTAAGHRAIADLWRQVVLEH